MWVPYYLIRHLDLEIKEKTPKKICLGFFFKCILVKKNFKALNYSWHQMNPDSGHIYPFLVQTPKADSLSAS